MLYNSLKEEKEIIIIGYLSKTKFIDTIAEFSYSTYLFHFPIIALIISLLYDLGYNCIQSQPTMIYLLTYFIIEKPARNFHFIQHKVFIPYLNFLVMVGYNLIKIESILTMLVVQVDS